jgi:uncharacterized membrane protein YdfJ with MMPL/SSD domain
MGSLQAFERSAWCATGVALAVGIASVFLDWLSGIWVLMPFAAAVLGLVTIWQLRRMPEALRQAMDRATDRARTRRVLVESLVFSALLIALAFTSLPIPAVLAIMFPFLLLVGVREYVLTKRKLELEHRASSQS